MDFPFHTMAYAHLRHINTGRGGGERDRGKERERDWTLGSEIALFKMAGRAACPCD